MCRYIAASSCYCWPLRTNQYWLAEGAILLPIAHYCHAWSSDFFCQILSYPPISSCLPNHSSPMACQPSRLQRKVMKIINININMKKKTVKCKYTVSLLLKRRRLYLSNLKFIAVFWKVGRVPPKVACGAPGRPALAERVWCSLIPLGGMPAARQDDGTRPVAKRRSKNNKIRKTGNMLKSQEVKLSLSETYAWNFQSCIRRKQDYYFQRWWAARKINWPT